MIDPKQEQIQETKQRLLPAVWVPEDKDYEISLRSPYGTPSRILENQREILMGMIRGLVYQSLVETNYEAAHAAMPERELEEQFNGSCFKGETLNHLRGVEEFDNDQWYMIVDKVAYPCKPPPIARDLEDDGDEMMDTIVYTETQPDPSDVEEKRGHIKYEHMHQTYSKPKRKASRDRNKAQKKARRNNRK